MTQSIPTETGTCDGSAHRNAVALVGRLAAVAESRALPSGDLLTTFRVIVARPPTSPGLAQHPPRSRAPSVDTIDCVAWSDDVRRGAQSWQPGDTVEVEGSLRRRFWRSAGGTASRSEVEVVRACRLRAAAVRSAGEPLAGSTEREPTVPARSEAAAPADVEGQAGLEPELASASESEFEVGLEVGLEVGRGSATATPDTSSAGEAGGAVGT